MSRSDHVQPFPGVYFIRTDNIPDIVTENFRRSTRKGFKANLFQFAQKLTDRQTQRLRAMSYLEW